MPIERMSHADRIQRRKDIAAAVTDIASMGQIASEFGVSLETVRVALRVYAPQKLAGYVKPSRFRVNAATA